MERGGEGRGGEGREGGASCWYIYMYSNAIYRTQNELEREREGVREGERGWMAYVRAFSVKAALLLRSMACTR